MQFIKRQNWIKNKLLELKSKGLYRKLNTIQSPSNNRIIKDGKELILLSSNNYLGLTTHQDVINAALWAIQEYGTGSGGSRLTSGNIELYDKLEERIAKWKNTEDAIVFSTGYMANIGTITSLVGKDDLVLSDELNHASIIDGCRLSRAEIKVYPHLDVFTLENFLKTSTHKKKLIVTDGIFSMDGDIAPLCEISELAEKYNAMLMVDDAHSSGVLGKNRRGVAEYFNVNVDIEMGTLSKALASIGGYVAGSFELIDYLRNSARSFIYSTALPPASLWSAKAAIDVIENEDPAKKLWENVSKYRNGLIDIGFSIKSKTQIIPIIIGDSEKTLEASSLLEKLGVYASGIRPPSVPLGSGRIRTSIMASHTDEDIEHSLFALKEIKEKFNLC